MAKEGKGEDPISTKKLNWKKSADYGDKFSDTVSVMTSRNSVILDFGLFDEEGKEGGEERLISRNPYVLHHTRIRVSPEHFREIVKIMRGLVGEGGEK